MAVSRTRLLGDPGSRGLQLFALAVVLLQGCCMALVDQDFSPAVTASCKAGFMTIRVHTNQSFYGALQARDYRSQSCMSFGNGSADTVLSVNLRASQGEPDYCGVFYNNRTGDRSLPIAVRLHRTLELADDKFYVITCGKAGFKNANNETSLVSLKLLDKGKRVQEALKSHAYTLRAEISRPDGTYGIRVKSCFAFDKRNSSVNLIDDKGCPTDARIISQFKFDRKLGVADATLRSMFRFSESSEVHFQCDIVVCKGSCSAAVCGSEPLPLPQAVSQEGLDEPSGPEEGVLMASTSVYVLEPGDVPASTLQACDDGIHPLWLLYLCIAFGIMFLIMLLINIFLCSAMTCACSRTEVIEKEPSIIEDYDPYKSWHGSQYGSRYSLNGKPGYTSGGSTMNSTRSISTNSDHYAIVHSRPGSRYSAPGSHKAATLAHPQHNGHHRGPPSNVGSHYSAGKM
ncbi:cuticlin-4 [Bacillus rossius redtenbacheri]|uniref:cuticlin-4 n=1 Tax=Bacillus rossius redtenbacheri TaxID=93214 RepID=UPI002FDE27CA